MSLPVNSVVKLTISVGIGAITQSSDKRLELLKINVSNPGGISFRHFFFFLAYFTFLLLLLNYIIICVYKDIIYSDINI